MRSTPKLVCVLLIGSGCAAPRAPTGKAESSLGSPVVVRVVDGPTSEPIAGATVRYRAQRSVTPDEYLRWSRQILALRPGIERELVPLESAVTNARGEAHLPSRSSGSPIVVTSGERIAVSTDERAADGSVRITLPREEHVDVQVLGPEGRPLGGVPVEVRAWYPEEPEDGFQGAPWVRTLLVRQTDVQTGVARFSEISYLRHLARGGIEMDTCVCLMGRPSGTVHARLELRDGEQVELRLPEHAVLTIDLVGPPGRTLESSKLSADFPAGGVGKDDGAEWSSVSGTTLRLLVALGQRGKLTGSARGWRSVEFDVRSPSEAGADLRVVLELTTRVPSVRGRLVDAKGSPIPKRPIFAASDGHERTWGDEDVRPWTDAEGRFELFIDPAIVEADGDRFAFHLGCFVDDGEYGFLSLEENTLHGEIALPDLPVEGTVDVGDVVAR